MKRIPLFRLSGLLPLATAAALTVSLVPSGAQAATKDYTGANITTTGAFAAADNWSPAGAVTDSLTADIARFNLSSYAQPTLTSAGRSVNGLIFGDGATSTADVTITITGAAGQQLRLGGNGIVMNANSGNATVNKMALGADQTWTNNSANLLSVSGVTGSWTAAAGNFTVTLNGTGRINFGGAINDNVTGTARQGLIVSGATVTSGGANTYTGGTTVNSGSLTLSGANTNASGGIVVNGGTLKLGNNAALGATANTLTINGGTIDVTAARTTTNNNAQNWNGDFTFNGTNTWNTGTGAVTMNASREVTVSASTMTVGGAIGDGGSGYSLTKAGAGALVLSGANTYTGTTTIKNGSVSVASVNTNLGGSGTIVLGDGTTTGTLITTTPATGNLTTEDVTRNIDLAGTTGGGTLTVNNGANSTVTFSGNIGSSGAGSKILTLNGSSTAVQTISGIISDNSVTNTTSIVVGDSKWKLTGNNTFSGGVTVNNNGALITGSNNALGTGTLTMNGGNWSPSGNNVIANAISIITGSNGNAGSSTSEFTGQITGTGNWTVNGFAAGKMKLSGDNSGWTGNYKISGANTLQLNHANALGSGTTFTFSDAATGRGVLESLVDVNLSQSISVGSNSSITGDATFKTTANMTVTGVISGAAGLGITKTGNATLTLSGNNTYTGNTTVTAGTMVINGDQTAATGLMTVSSGATLKGSGIIGGNVTIAGNLAPGNSPGTLTINGDLTLLSTSLTTAEVTGTGAGQFDRIIGVQALTYGGNLTLDLTGTYGSATWDLFDFVTHSGDFASVNFTGSYVGSLTLTSTDTWTGVVGGQNWTFLQSNGQLSVIPEPATWALLAAGLTVTVVLRRRRSNV